MRLLAARQQAGFTLVELVLVMILMGIMSLIALPRLVNWQGVDEIAFRDDLRAMLRYAQKLAINQNRDVCVILSPIAHSAYLQYGVANSCTAGVVLHPDDSQPYQIQAPNGLALASDLIYFNRLSGTVLGGDHPLTIGSLPAPALTVISETGFVACHSGSTVVC